MSIFPPSSYSSLERNLDIFLFYEIIFLSIYKVDLLEYFLVLSVNQ